MFAAGAKYDKMELVFARAEVSAFRTATKLIFVVVHSGEPGERVEQLVEKVHSRYTGAVLHNPLYGPEERIAQGAFDDLI